MIPLSFGFALLVVIVLGTAWLTRLQQVDEDAAQRALMVEAKISEVFSLVQGAETGQRGYLLTRDPDYLTPYELALEHLEPALLDLRGSFVGNAAQESDLRRLEGLIRNKMNELQSTVELAEEGRAEAAIQDVRAGAGRAFMEQIQELVGRLKSVEEQLLAQNLASARFTGRLLQAGILIAIVAILGLAAFAIQATRRRTEIMLEQQDELQQSNQQLVAEMARRESAEAQMRQMHKLEGLGQLTGGIAHDFNNMLAVVISGLNLIQRRLARGETDVAELIDGTMDGATRAAALTQRLLAFSRQQPLAPKAIDANKFVADMSELLRRTLGEHIRVESVLAGGLWATHADPSELENAILNLCVNGRDAMPEGGRLTIETANCHLDDNYGGLHDIPAGQYVQISVTDTGSGMSSELIKKAFDPFFTTKRKGDGTGLGLSQVFGFVKQSGGHVKIYSELGEGTTVKIYLPRFVGETEAALPPRREPLPTGDGRQVVLVVEDEPRVRELSVASLRELGYTVIHAESAVSALRQLDSHPDVDLLFTDIVMPDVNGRALADEAIQRRPELKVLFTTGFTRNAVVHNGVLDAGVNFLQKPFTLEQLAEKVNGVLTA
jgi:signal transduction histidine kinase